MSLSPVGPRSRPVTALGTPLSPSATRVMLLGAGELGKEVTIELMRLGAWVCAADSYTGAPAQQVANEARVLDMADAAQLRALLQERSAIFIEQAQINRIWFLTGNFGDD